MAALMETAKVVMKENNMAVLMVVMLVHFSVDLLVRRLGK